MNMNRIRTESPCGISFAEYLLAGMVWLFVACSESLEQDVSNELTTDTLQLAACSQLYVDDEAGQTRGVTDDYEVYTTAPISIYMTPLVTTQPGLFRYSETAHKWSSTINVKEGQQYYIYGFTPAGAVRESTVEPYSGNYAYGAFLTLKGVSPVSDKDLCIVVGAKSVESATSPVPSDLKPGKFDYLGKVKGSNFAYLLLHHLCAKLSFLMRVDDEEEYANLRTVKVTKMELTSLSSTYEVRVWLQPNSTGADPVRSITWAKNGSDSDTSDPFFEDEEGRELTTSYQNMKDVILPAMSSLTLKCTYDVYDKSGNLVRGNCTATNVLKSDVLNLVRGKHSTIRMTVKPTYLYVLSDEDEPFIVD